MSWAPVPHKPTVSVNVKQHVNHGELDCHEEVRLSFVGPGEIKRREVVLDPQESPGEIKSREVELGSES